ncbi:hypothetical protein LXM94_12690 [Rhizobium sp. TRM95111]|uniref:hypothetical protein n=1 Tax=Rhizobium alarense TaxID=2846851 RepID=UPI001F2E9B40|nr:hypothetical protein [Rhizobium alarense]MCF3640826.1 hypothetical protein [Rhizobium alarense]
MRVVTDRHGCHKSRNKEIVLPQCERIAIELSRFIAPPMDILTGALRMRDAAAHRT